jgi:outer membrane phospholipase A
VKAWLWLGLALHFPAAAAADWVISSRDARAEAGAPFEIVALAPPREPLPEAVTVRITFDVAEIEITMRASGPELEGRRAYSATMPAAALGPVTLRLAEQPSNALVLVVARRDVVQSLASGADEREPPLSENDPMYFVVGTRGGTNARFQLSFKYRLFDAGSGLGQDRPWLSGLYFGYTQNSLWDIAAESKAFRDTSYRPSLFWKWERAQQRRALFDGARVGLEHESNGGQGETSRSIHTAFVRPEWKWNLRQGARFEFTPKVYAYLDKEENPDIEDYRGYVDWRARFDSGTWIATTVLRYGTAGKGSLLLDVSRRTRDLKFGPVSTYFHVQFFAGYGESILDYNVKHKSQLRFGFAIVP